MKAVLFIIGLISILGQVVLLRELNVASFGVELVYILALGFWLAATALGALFCRSSRAARCRPRWRGSARRYRPAAG
jgi:hypothetical protein